MLRIEIQYPTMQNHILYKTALPFMTSLRDAFSETVGLAVLDEKAPDGIIIGQVQGTQRFSFRLAVGEHFPLHTGAPGKAIVAFLPLKQQNSIVSRISLTKFNERTICTKRTFVLELGRIRKRGYSTDLAEEVEGCHCVSAPVLDTEEYPMAAVWVTGPSSRFPEEMFGSIAPEVINTARAITHALNIKAETGTTFMNHVIGMAEQYINEHIDENFDMEQLAKELNVGYTSFRHWFKAIHGIGPAQYHLKQRVDTAKKLLRTSTKTVAFICRTLGYEDQNYFSALFKKKTGMSPMMYRQKTHRHDRK
jgi:DNA-binding IclR family transcriptional regulator/AraC-like DNA-binding protein